MNSHSEIGALVGNPPVWVSTCLEQRGFLTTGQLAQGKNRRERHRHWGPEGSRAGGHLWVGEWNVLLLWTVLIYVWIWGNCRCSWTFSQCLVLCLSLSNIDPECRVHWLLIKHTLLVNQYAASVLFWLEPRELSSFPLIQYLNTFRQTSNNCYVL